MLVKSVDDKVSGRTSESIKIFLHPKTEIGLNVKGVDRKDVFYAALKGKSDPEEKRKAIGKLFIDVFQEEASDLTNISF